MQKALFDSNVHTAMLAVSTGPHLLARTVQAPVGAGPHLESGHEVVPQGGVRSEKRSLTAAGAPPSIGGGYARALGFSPCQWQHPLP